MFKRTWVKLLITPVIVMALLIFPISKASGQGDPLPVTQGKMNEIMDRQTETLQKLFAQEQKIGAMEKAEEGIDRDIEGLNQQIAGLQRSIAEEEMVYAQKKEGLRQLLQSYQKMGPGSYLEIILESNDLSDFLHRLNLLSNMTSNTEKLLMQLQSSKEKQAADQAKLTGELASLKDKQVHLNESMAKEKQLKKDLEDDLASLSTEREKYQKDLIDLQNKWAELKPSFSKAVKELSGIIEEEKLPLDAFKLTYDFSSIKVSIADDALNKMIAEDPGFPQMVFSFQPGNVEMRVPDKNLILEGTFVIQGGNNLKFQVKDGRFNGIPLEIGSINELFQDGDLVINLSPVLGSYTLNSLVIRDGNLEFSILPEF